MSTQTPAKRGRPSKGVRDGGFFTRPDAAVGRVVRDRYEELGYDSMGDLISAAVAHFVGMPDRAPQPKPQTRISQDELPMTG